MLGIGYPDAEPLHSTTLIYIIWHDSKEAADANWKAFGADPEWQKVSKASDEHGKIVNHVERTYMSPTDYSPLK